MITFRIVQRASNHRNQHHIELTVEEAGTPRQTANVYTSFNLTEQDQEDLRWYLEEYLSYPVDPAPEIARRIERRMAEIGISLFQSILQSNDDVRDIWATLRPRLGETRIEVVTELNEASSIPWELLRDAKTDTLLLLNTRSFVRAHPSPAQRPKLPVLDSDALRILLVICRPGGAVDVPFRSVASRIVRSLTNANRSKSFHLEVLRPPTFGDLSRVLRAAQSSGQSYHIVHFDGHGVFVESDQLIGGISPLTFGDRRLGKHGYLLFENPQLNSNIELVDGPKLGALLVAAGSPVLVLNACRSAHSEALQTPAPVGLETPTDQNPHLDVRAFGSLAQEIMDSGAPAVVAMRYNVYVVTAAQFVADLYTALLQGYTLGEAVNSGRKQLHDRPLREIIYPARSLQDWMVPIVYEAAPLALLPRTVDSNEIRIDIHSTNLRVTPEQNDFPPPPDVGFFGRDETLLALDRAFDEHKIVLLHAFAGSGKTSAATEFARWYAFTKGVQTIIFTSFENYRPLPIVLDTGSSICTCTGGPRYPMVGAG